MDVCDRQNAKVSDRIGSFHYHECPFVSAQRSGIESVPMLSASLQNHTLPYSGGVMDQPAICIDAISVYSAQEMKDRKARERN